MKIESRLRHSKSNRRRSPRTRSVDFHGACVINENGDEVPITEQMVQQACHKLNDVWERAHRQRTSSALSVKNIRYSEK